MTGATNLKMEAESRDIHVLGVETSCDDTAAAVIRRAPDGRCTILSDEIWTQHDDHAAYGGVVPEIAARSHAERLDATVEKAMDRASLKYDQLDAVAATAGPGLVGGVMVGLTTAKAICLAHDKPLIPINHLEGHALSARMTEDAPFPYLLLLISGGHTQLIWVEHYGRYQRLGTTIDDAAGEAFDKTAKLLGLGQPGGPRVESAATGGRHTRFDFPRPLARRAGCDFSFSGLKTALREAAEQEAPLEGQDVADLAASMQFAAARHLAQRTQQAMAMISPAEKQPRLVVAGGVAANCAVKSALNDVCAQNGWLLIAPPAKYCTDNGAMIAWAGAEAMIAGNVPSLGEALSLPPRARWPLAPPPKGAEIGGGRKGPKA